MSDWIVQFLIQDNASWKVFSSIKPRHYISQKIPDRYEIDPKTKGTALSISRTACKTSEATVDYETHMRAWAKSLAWRFLGIVILGGISIAVTHDWKAMSLITLLFHSIRVILYYVHERLWNKIAWGRIRHPLSIFPVRREIEAEDREKIRKHLRTLGYLD